MKNFIISLVFLLATNSVHAVSRPFESRSLDARIELIRGLFTSDESIVSPDQITGVMQVFPHSEIYILQRIHLGDSKYAFYAEIESGPQSGKKVWIPFDFDSPSGKLFTSMDRDLLLYPTKDINNAYYLFSTEPIPAFEDNMWWFGIMEKFNTEELGTVRKCFYEHSYTNKLTATESETEIKATDSQEPCPKHPQKKNGDPCETQTKIKLNPLLRKYLNEASIKYNVHPAQIAAMIQKESFWNPFIENEYEKAKCNKLGAECSDYGWSKGLGQFGKLPAIDYGLDWDNDAGKVKRPEVCGKTRSQARSLVCTITMEDICRPYEEKFENGEISLIPISCPRAMILATAKHLKDAFPDEIPVWVKDAENKIVRRDILPIINENPNDRIRVQISYFQRGVRAINSYVELYDQTGEWPSSYGEAWVTPRLAEGEDKSPSKEMGYQMLFNEFINRCHIWSLLGLCGEIPESSLMGQYMSDFPGMEI